MGVEDGELRGGVSPRQREDGRGVPRSFEVVSLDNGPGPSSLDDVTHDG